MSYELYLNNRILVGFAIGWSYYSKDNDHDYHELNIYLGLISITLNIYQMNYRDFNKAIMRGQPQDNVEGLYVQDGRLINGRPDSMTGIQTAAMLKNSMKRAKKISMIADGIELANMRKDTIF